MSGFPERLIKALTDKQMTQGALAEASGMSATVISQYCCGKSDPTRASLIKIAKALNVNFLWLATGEGEKSPSKAAKGKARSVEQRLNRIEKLLGGMESMLSFTSNQIESLQDVARMIREELKEIDIDTLNE